MIQLVNCACITRQEVFSLDFYAGLLSRSKFESEFPTTGLWVKHGSNDDAIISFVN